MSKEVTPESSSEQPTIETPDENTTPVAPAPIADQDEPDDDVDEEC